MTHSPERKPALTMHQLREIASRISASQARTKLADELGVTLPILDDALASITARHDENEEPHQTGQFS